MAFIRPRVSSTSSARATERHGHPGYTDLPSALLRFGFRHAHPAQLRIHEDGIGHHAVAHRALAAIEQVGFQNAVVVVGDVGELRTSLHIANDVNPRGRGLQPLVGADKAPLVGLNAGRSGFERVGVGHPAGRQQEIGSFDRLRFALDRDLQGDAAIGARNFLRRAH